MYVDECSNICFNEYIIPFKPHGYNAFDQSVLVLCLINPAVFKSFRLRMSFSVLSLLRVERILVFCFDAQSSQFDDLSTSVGFLLWILS